MFNEIRQFLSYWVEVVKMWSNLHGFSIQHWFLSGLGFVTFGSLIAGWLFQVPGVFLISIVSGGFWLLTLIFYAPYRVYKESYPELAKAQKASPANYISAYISSVNAYELKLQDANHVILGITIVSALGYDIKIINPLLTLHMNGRTVTNVVLGPEVNIRNMSFQYRETWRIPVEGHVRSLILKAVDNNALLSVSATVRGHNEANQPIEFSSSEIELHPIVENTRAD